MFDHGSQNYRSDLKLGQKYRDETTGVIGHLVSIHFYEHACERGTLRYVDGDQNVQEMSFDAPELVHVDTNVRAVVSKTGGPRRSEGGR
ncbi:MAG TPA: hypothetical protein VMZ73_09140 [Acidimicrobiales bacterium]|nr:hypothetical protein [Acidimicrobiales bacterium]